MDPEDCKPRRCHSVVKLFYPVCLDLLGGTEATHCTLLSSLNADVIASDIYLMRLLRCRRPVSKRLILDTAVKNNSHFSSISFMTLLLGFAICTFAPLQL